MKLNCYLTWQLKFIKLTKNLRFKTNFSMSFRSLKIENSDRKRQNNFELNLKTSCVFFIFYLKLAIFIKLIDSTIYAIYLFLETWISRKLKICFGLIILSRNKWKQIWLVNKPDETEEGVFVVIKTLILRLLDILFLYSNI